VAEESPRDVKDVLGAERGGQPFLVLRDADGVQQIVALEQPRQRVVLGRDQSSDVCVAGDPMVSALHARLESTNQLWLLHDDGCSRNGSCCFATLRRVDPGRSSARLEISAS
jgi:diadenosine tetraphosphatase ApaH/serine/threonine PP2A family protein phosphatase